jgi:capsular polysaccharide biosynthesis protein
MQMKNSFIPFDLLKQITPRWWFFAMVMITGGLLGLFLHGFSNPIFEAKARFMVTIDYTRTGYLSDIQEDQAMRGIGSLIGSDLILQRAVEMANSSGLKISFDEFKQKSILERGEFDWFIRFRDKDPQKATDLVNLWADQADQELKKVSSHALRAEELLNYLDSIETCLQRTTLGNDAKAPCTFPNLSKILEEIQKTGELAYQEKEASRGIMPALSINLVEKSQVAPTPVLYNRNSFILAGSFFGLILGIFIAFLLRNKPIIKRLRG